MKLRKKSENGFSLVELVIVLGILGIILAIAVIQYGGVRDSTHLNLTKSRLMLVADAQHKFRTALGKRRYGSLCFELKKVKTPSGDLLPDSVAKFDDNCKPTIVAGKWAIYDGIESESFDTEPLKSGFAVYARQQGVKHPEFCMFEDLV